MDDMVALEKDLAWIFEKMALLYESHYWLETLYETKFQPVWTEIEKLLVSVSPDHQGKQPEGGAAASG